MLACGGTGGHIFPALALAIELMDRGHEVMLVTDERGARFLDPGMEATIIPATAFFGRSLGDKLRSIGAYLKGKRQAKRLIDAFKPDAVIGGGGYASFPVIRAAKAKKVPIFLLEQNSVPGRVTRLSTRIAREIYCGIPVTPVTPARTPSGHSHHYSELDSELALGSQGYNTSLKGKAVLTGNVLRKSVILPKRKEGKEILVLGGSGGARRLNELGYELAQKMPGEKFIVLTGSRDYPDMKAKPPLANLELVGFTAHPEELYARARVAISRSGAIFISELLVNGIPSILIPFPYAVDDHQTCNARWAQDRGAAVSVPERGIGEVEGVLRSLLGDRTRRRQMSKAGKNLVSPDAARVIAERIEKCLAG